MSHEITIREDGFAEAVFALKPAWHGLGKVYDHPMTSKEIIEDPDNLLNWRVVQRPVAMGNKSEGDSTNWTVLPGYSVNCREDNGKILGMVSDKYRVVQNAEAFEFLDALVEGHEMLYESAFSLYGGRRVCLLARMPGFREVVPGDPILPYILMSLSHDGSEAIRFGPVATRVVCANTYASAAGEGTTKHLIINHKGDIKTKLMKARSILALANRYFEQYAELGRQLAQKSLSKQEWKEYLDIMCPELDPRDPDYSDLRAERIADTRIAINRRYHNERNTLDGIANTAWAAYNAVCEHIDHLPRRGATRRRQAEARFNVCLYGVGRNMKHRALQTACRFAGIELSLAM